MSRNSGRTETVIIACITTEVAKVVEPALHYRATEVHIIHSEPDGLYGPFFAEAKRRLESSGIGVTAHPEDIHDHMAVMRLVSEITEDALSRYGRDYTEVFVNISSGTQEYAAGAMLATMTESAAKPFSVRTREFSRYPDEVLEFLSVDGVPVGSTLTTEEPSLVKTFAHKAPSRQLVDSLALFDRIFEDERYGTSTRIIQVLKDNDLWDHKDNSRSRNPNLKENEKQYFFRHYIDPMIRKGWIEKNGGRGYRLLDGGYAALRAFYKGPLLRNEQDACCRCEKAAENFELGTFYIEDGRTVTVVTMRRY